MKTLLKNAKIYDGTGSPAFLGDVLIGGERILRVAPNLSDAETRVIDLRGRSLASGFIDAHSHNDWFAIKKDSLPYFEPFIRQGICSFVTGNCGLSAAGFEKDTPNLEKIGGGLFGYRGEVTGVYPTVDELLSAVDGKAPCNIASFISPCTFCRFLSLAFFCRYSAHDTVRINAVSLFV